MFRTLRPSTAAGALLLAFALPLAASAVQLVPSQTFHKGTRIACVLVQTMSSTTLTAGTDFTLRVVDTSYPSLEGAKIHGVITDVTQPNGINPARVAFLLRTIHLRNGETKDIRAYVVNRGVVRYNPAAQRAQRIQLPPANPNAFGTPGPIAWQMRIGIGGGGSGGGGGRKIEIGDNPKTAVGGYVYGSGPGKPIIAHAGTPVTVELASHLTIP